MAQLSTLVNLRWHFLFADLDKDLEAPTLRLYGVKVDCAPQ